MASHIDENPTDWPQIITTGDGEFFRNYAIRNYPAVFLIDPNGMIVEAEIKKSIHDIEQYAELILSYLDKKQWLAVPSQKPVAKS